MAKIKMTIYCRSSNSMGKSKNISGGGKNNNSKINKKEKSGS